MAFFSNKKKQANDITVMAEGICVFRGPLEELPIDEGIMLKKSVEFYNDPKPCYIHRGGVRQKLVAELETCFQQGKRPDSPEGVAKLREYMDCEEINEVIFA